MGHAEPESFCEVLATLQQRIARNTEHKIFHSPAHDEPENNLILLDDYDSLIVWLSENGFTRPNDIADTLSGWMAGELLLPAASGQGFC